MAQQCRLVMPYEGQGPTTWRQEYSRRDIENHRASRIAALDHAVFMELEMDCIFVDGGGC